MIPILALTGLFLIYLEFFMPGAVMAIGGTLMLLTSLVLYFYQASHLYFYAYAIGLSIALVITLRLAMSRIRKGKMLHQSDQEGFFASSFSKELIGKSGIATSDLKPSGYVEVEGQIYSALSQIGYIDKNASIKIIGGQGNHLIVSVENVHR